MPRGCVCERPACAPVSGQQKRTRVCSWNPPASAEPFPLPSLSLPSTRAIFSVVRSCDKWTAA